MLSTTACSGGFRYRPTTSFTFEAKFGSRLTLYVRTRWGLRLLRRSTSDTQPGDRRTSLASRRAVHRLRPAGGGDIASWTMRSTVSAGTAWSLRPDLGRRSPSTPPVRKHDRNLDTGSAEGSG